MDVLSPADVVLRLIESINQGDPQGISLLTARRFRYTDPEGLRHDCKGPEEVRESWERFLAAHPDYRIRVEQVLRSGEGVAVLGRTTGAHLPEDVEESGTVLWTAELEDGLVSGWRTYRDDPEIEEE